jgi:2-oxoacid:acceptor oxidoreductase gamma subunit (pyruvate/2-ketoisovalerate family)/2-oxoacid:acceptor oxidoreductase delta subunit (pyruvate/2-ketoisovalerate family)
MSSMKELLLVGRGGEGVVLASQVLADAFARCGWWVQSFPEFKAERRGAPIAAFLRWDEHEPIRRRYKLRDCDVLAVVSPSPPSPELLARVRPGGLVILNRETRLPEAGDFHIVRVPASRIAQTHGIHSAEGRPLGNVAVLGACVRMLAPDGLRFLEAAVAARLGGRADANIAAARAGFEQCLRQHTLASDHRLERPELASVTPRLPAVYPVSSTDSRPNRTGTWSLDRPILLGACNACALCAVFCPEGAITRVAGTMIVDYDHCKGCGICEVVCPVRNAIEMEAVPA